MSYYDWLVSMFDKKALLNFSSHEFMNFMDHPLSKMVIKLLERISKWWNMPVSEKWPSKKRKIYAPAFLDIFTIESKWKAVEILGDWGPSGRFSYIFLSNNLWALIMKIDTKNEKKINIRWMNLFSSLLGWKVAVFVVVVVGCSFVRGWENEAINQRKIL